KAVTSKIPIVFANGVDPVEVGLVASLSRPGGNITGVTFLINTLGPKELEALHDLRPEATVIAALINPNLATTASQSKDVEAAARALGLQVRVLHASTEREIEIVFESLPASGRLAGNYTGSILKGEKPADLPVQQSTNTELVINLKTAKLLGLTFPITLLGRADEAIE